MIALKYVLGYSPGGEGGRGFFASMMLLVGVLGAVFAVWQSLNVAYRFYDLRNQLTYLIGSAEIAPDLEIKKRVLGVMKGAGISTNEQDIVLERLGDRVKAELPYRHDLMLLIAGKQLRLASIPLKLSVEKRIKKAAGSYDAGLSGQETPALR
jgi:hypothetical protein